MPAGAERILTADTSVAVPLVVRTHEAHDAVVRWRAGRALSLCGHAWIETYAVLTRLAGRSRLAGEDAVRVLGANFAAPLAPSPETYAAGPRVLAASGVAGGATYDGWIAIVALEHMAVLASRDARAESTYRRLGVDVEMVPAR
jgi:hypothetical protein